MTFHGKCPKRGTILMKSAFPREQNESMVRCPSCREHFHRISTLEWSEI